MTYACNNLPDNSYAKMTKCMLTTSRTRTSTLKSPGRPRPRHPRSRGRDTSIITAQRSCSRLTFIIHSANSRVNEASARRVDQLEPRRSPPSSPLISARAVRILRLRALHIHSAPDQENRSGGCPGAYSGQLQITTVAKNHRDLCRIRSRFPADVHRRRSTNRKLRKQHGELMQNSDRERAAMINRVGGPI